MVLKWFGYVMSLGQLPADQFFLPGRGDITDDCVGRGGEGGGSRPNFGNFTMIIK